MATTYNNAAAYIETATSVKAKIACIDDIIAGLLNSALAAVENEDVDEYWLDDGQTKIKTIYRSSAQIMSAISKYRALKNQYLNQVNGHIMTLRDRNSNRPKRNG